MRSKWLVHRLYLMSGAVNYLLLQVEHQRVYKEGLNILQLAYKDRIREDYKYISCPFCKLRMGETLSSVNTLWQHVYNFHMPDYLDVKVRNLDAVDTFDWLGVEVVGSGEDKYGEYYTLRLVGSKVNE